ncbi:MAG: hypothetical protein R2749_19330 [Acidimicrobiales bacterium]
MSTEQSTMRPAARHALRSLLASLATVLVLSTTFLVSGAANAGASEYPAAEYDAVWLINQTRGAAGLGAVGQDPWLTILARIHADRLAGDNRLYHQDLQVPLSWGWRWVGENVAYSSLGLIDAHRALERSPGHLENMRVGAAFAAGTGISFGHSRMFLVQLLAY